MSVISHLEMHQDHSSWRADDALWRDELAIWQREIEDAIKELPKLVKTLRVHAETLRKHAASIRIFEHEFAKHEHTLAEFEMGEAPADLVELARTHPHESNHHKDRYATHEELKEKQHALMAKWRSLFTSLLELTLTSKTASNYKSDGGPIESHVIQIS